MVTLRKRVLKEQAGRLCFCVLVAASALEFFLRAILVCLTKTLLCQASHGRAATFCNLSCSFGSYCAQGFAPYQCVIFVTGNVAILRHGLLVNGHERSMSPAL